MKKVLIITVVIALAIMLAFPSILFAEEGDANSTVGVRDTDGDGVQTYGGTYTDQYILGDESGICVFSFLSYQARFIISIYDRDHLFKKSR